MKKLIAIVLAVLMVACFAACAATEDPNTSVTDGNASAGDVTDGDALATDGDAVVTDGDAIESVVTDGDVLATDGDADEEIVEDETAEDAVASDDSAALANLKAVWADVIADEQLIAAFGVESSEEVANYFAGGNEGVMGEPAAHSLEDKEILSFMFGVPTDKTDAIVDASSIIHGMNPNNLTAAAYVLAEGEDAAAFATAMKDGVSSMQFLCGAPEQLIIAEYEGSVIVAFGGADIIGAFSRALSANGTILVEDALI